MSKRAFLVLVALTLAPAASAGAPIEGRASFSSDASLEGRARLAADEGALDLSEALRAAAPLALSWTSATGRLVAVDWTVASARWDLGYAHEEDGDNRSLRFGDASIVGLSCGATCQFVVFAERGAGRLAMAGAVRGPARWLEDPHLYWANWQEPRRNGFVRSFPEGTLLVGGAGLPVGEAHAEAEGRLGLFVENATLLVETSEGNRIALDVGARRSPVAHLPGGARVEEVHSRFLYMDMEGVRLSLGAGEGAQLLAPRLHVDLQEGTLSADDARGHFTYGGRRGTLAGEPLDVTGALALDLRVHPDAGPGGRVLLEGRSLEASFRGEATSVRAGDLRVASLPPERPSVTGATLGLAFLATLPWWLPRLVLAPLYSRIHRGSVLQNGNRAGLHRLVGEDPGRTPAELARILGMARIVVRHHLRMLEAHRLVVCRPDGRRRRYYLPDAPLGEGSALHLLLREGPRRKVAEALGASSTPLTQQEIADRTGFSPRLVSYHLARLASLDVVERLGSRPAAYALRAPAVALLDEGE